MASISYKNSEIHYKLEGAAGPALVLLHGFCEDSRIWDDFKQPFLSTYRVLTLDLPGFGQSSIAEACSIQDMGDTLKAVLDAAQIEKCLLIGHSMGGYIALAFAERYASYLAGLGLFHSHAYADTEAKKAARSKSVEFVERNGVATFVAQIIPSLFPKDFSTKQAALVEDLIKKAESYPSMGITNALLAMRDRPDRSGVLEAIPVPVLFILGKLDEAIPYEASIQQTVLPNRASIHLLEDVAHMGQFEAMEETQHIVQNFLGFVTDKIYSLAN